MMQGDAYKIPIQVVFDGTIAVDDDFSEVEIVIGDLRKTKLKGEVTYDTDQQAFMFPMTQEESFKFRDFGLGHSMQEVQVRVKTPQGDVYGVSAGKIDVLDAISTEVI